MKGKGPLSRLNKFFIALLVLSVAVNGTQAVVLCAGCDGHIAVEMAGHHHCHNTNGCQRESSNEADEHETPCRLCVDIPLSPGIGDGPGVQKMPAMNALSAGIAPSIPDTTDHDLEGSAAVGTFLAFTPFYDPLNNIILIV